MTAGTMLADILTPTDAAALLGVTRDHICLLIRRGDIVATRLGARGWVILRSDLDRARRHGAGAGRWPAK